MALHKLPNDIQSLLCASVQICSYKKAIEELVYNCLDADATCIAIRVNIVENSLQVMDNGCGLAKSDFDLIGERHATSKCVDLSSLKSVPNKYGYRGLSLASIIEVSQSVTISSRLENTKETWTKSFYKGKQQKLHETSQRPSKGTTVEIKGFLYNLNIQRKTINTLNELNNIKAFLEQLSLVHYSVSLSLRDDSKNEIIFELHKNRDIYQTFKSMFGIDKSDIQELKVEKNEYKVTAYIGKPDKELDLKHWIYLNGKLLHNSKVHKVVNDELEKALKLKRKKTKTELIYDKQECYLQKKLPTYFIFINCPYYDYDLNSTGKKTVVEFKNWEQINKLVEKLAKFYAGDMKLKEIKPVVNQVGNGANVGNTRDQVRKIMEKILESHPKKFGISQMKKGVKGKLVKRKDKQKKQKISLSKIINNKNTKDSENVANSVNINHDMPEIGKLPNNISTAKVKQRTKKDYKILTNNNQVKPKSKDHITVKDKIDNQIKNKCKSTKVRKEANCIKQTEGNNAIHNRSKRQESMRNGDDKSYKKRVCAKKLHKVKNKVKRDCKKIKNKPKDDVVLKKFKDDPTGSVKRRCGMLEEKIDCLMSYKKKRKRKIFINETIQYSNVVQNNKSYSIRKKVGQIEIHDYVPLPPKFSPCSFDDRVWDKIKKKPHKSSYDLVKTILKTQETVEQRNISPDEVMHISSIPNLPIDVNAKPSYTELGETPQMPELTIDQRNITPSDVMHLSSISILPNDFNTKPSYTDLDETPQMRLLNRLTYESHNYDNERYNTSHNYIVDSNENLDQKPNHIVNHMQFISTNSRQNFNVPERQIQRKSYRSKQFTFQSNRFHEAKANKFNFFKNVYDMEESSYSIEFSKTNSIRQKQVDSIIDPSQSQNVQQIDEHTYTIEQNDQSAKFGSTCCVSINDSTNNMDTQNHADTGRCENVQDICNTGVNVDSPMATTISQHFGNHILTRNVCNDNDTYHDLDENNRNIFFISKSQEQSIERYINPLDACETVYSNNELEENASRRKQNDSLFNGDLDIDSFLCDRNAYSAKSAKEDLCLSRDEIFEQRITNPANNETDNGTKHTEHISEVIDLCSKEVFDGKRNQMNDDIGNNNFNFKTRLRFIPKGMSQIFKNCQTKNVCDYNLDNDYYEEEIYNKLANEIELNAKIFEPNIQNVNEITTRAIDKVNSKLKKDNASLIFNGEALKHAKVFRQIDKKFIAAKIWGSSHQSSEPSEYLVLFDQHAVHERIRLENNLKDYLKENRWKSIPVDDIIINVPKDVTIFLHNYEEKFAQLGLQWTILSDRKLSINAIPEALLGKNPRQVDIVIKAVKNLISEEISCIKTQSGCISLYPKSIMDLVFSESCRYAIKFGDKLSTQECTELLNALSGCKTPFQCAHGRPVMAVIMEIKSKKRDYKVKLANICKWWQVQKK